jgi:hypothetical protein
VLLLHWGGRRRRGRGSLGSKRIRRREGIATLRVPVAASASAAPEIKRACCIGSRYVSAGRGVAAASCLLPLLLGLVLVGKQVGLIEARCGSHLAQVELKAAAGVAVLVPRLHRAEACCRCCAHAAGYCRRRPTGVGCVAGMRCCR